VLAAVLVAIGWRSVFVWLGLAHLALVPLLLQAIPAGGAGGGHAARANDGLGIATAARTQRFWLLVAVYAICGFDDFFVSTHVVAFAQDRGVDAYLAGNLLALMGLTGLLGVLVSGAWSDRAGPVWPTAACFAVRVAVFALVMIDQSPLSVAVFALAFGSTFMVTAPLAVVFVAQSFGMRHHGAQTGLITMVHHVCGGIGAYLGAAVFDATGGYELAFLAMLTASLLALVLTLLLHRPARHALV
jgi:predicted MFS family arabinose efflux permease